VFGYRGVPPLQREIIEHMVGGGDAFVLMPTRRRQVSVYQKSGAGAYGNRGLSCRRSSR